MSSGVVKKMLGEFIATDIFFKVVPVIVKTDVKRLSSSFQHTVTC